jgi:hypothetical protein
LRFTTATRPKHPPGNPAGAFPPAHHVTITIWPRLVWPCGSRPARTPAWSLHFSLVDIFDHLEEHMKRYEL